jgi:subfamily B ATP-binding cassette protein MsbA
MTNVSEKVIRDIKNRIYSKLLNQSLDFYNTNPTGILMSRITYDSAVVRDAIGTGVADTFYQPIELMVYFVALIGVKLYFGIPWSIIVIGSVIFPLILFPVRKIGKRLRDISHRSQEKIADITNMLIETISGIKLVKSFNMQSYEKKKFAALNQKFYKLTMQAVSRMKLVSPLTEATGVVCVAVILWVAGGSIVTGKLSAGAFSAFLAAIFSMMKPVKRLTGVYGVNQQALAATERIYAILNAPVSDKEASEPKELETFRDEIRFNHVHFSYRKDTEKNKIFSGIDLVVRKGEVVALVGPSGSGKTTLVNLINRFYDPDEGAVLIDGINIKELSLKSLREKIGLVTQETFLFNDTVRANLCYGHEDIDDERLIEAACAANAHEFITDLPYSYDTVVGEKGVRLSGGQRQRLAIARAVYKNPPILILDEATSHLDSESEKLVQDALNNLMSGRTVIAIAHRLSTITHADRIVVMDKGQIVDIGPHSDLIRRNPLYKRLYDIQFASTEVTASI